MVVDVEHCHLSERWLRFEAEIKRAVSGRADAELALPDMTGLRCPGDLDPSRKGKASRGECP